MLHVHWFSAFNPEERTLVLYLGARPWPIVQDLDLEVRRRAYKKRSSGSFFWNLGPSLRMGVRMYALIMKARPGAPLNLDNLTNAPVKVEGKHVCADSGS